MKIATDKEVEMIFYVMDYCSKMKCRYWRDSAEAITQCKIASYASAGENYKNYWQWNDEGELHCTKFKPRGRNSKKLPESEIFKLLKS